MRNVRRFYIPDAIIFITSITQDRLPLFAEDRWRDLLFATMRRVQQLHPFHLLAYAILPEHVHWLMQSPADVTYSDVMHSIKRNFTLNYKSATGGASPLRVWQARFWDHVIRDPDDLWRHFDYVHYNPVKHELVTRPEDWPCSSFGFWRDRGYYEQGWGWTEPDHIRGMGAE